MNTLEYNFTNKYIMKFNIDDKVQFINEEHLNLFLKIISIKITSSRASAIPKLNETYIINNRAFDKNTLKNYYSLKNNKNEEIFWVQEEDLISIKKIRQLKIKQINETPK